MWQNKNLLITSVLFVISLTVFRLPMLFKESPFVFAGVLSIYWLFIAYRILCLSLDRRRNYYSVLVLLMTIVFFYPFLISLSFSNDEFSYIVGKALYFLTIILFAVLSIPILVNVKYLVFKLLYLNVLIYLLGNLSLDLIGVERIKGFNESIGNGQIAGIFSLDIRRKLLPLASSINSMGIIVSAFLTINILLWLNKPKNVFLALVTVLSSYLLLVTDTRSGLFLVMFFVLSYLFYSKIVTSISRVIFLLWLVVPFLITFVMTSDWAVLDIIRRPGETNRGDAFIRASVWMETINTLFKVDLNLFLGYGFRGNLNAGIAATIKKLIKMDVDVPTSHNFILQTIVDFGLIGASIFFLFINKILVLLRKEFRQKAVHTYSKMALIVLLMILLSGVNEAIPSYYSDDLFIVFILLSFAVIYDDINQTKNKLSNLKLKVT